MAQEMDDDVVHGLYEAGAGLREWPSALALLSDTIGGVQGAQLVVVDKRNGNLVRSEQPGHTPADAVLEYVRHYHRLDPHTPMLATLPVGQVFHTADHFPRREYADHPFYREFWAPYKVQSFVGAKLIEDDDLVAMLGVMRSTEVSAYSRAEIALAGRYFRHLVVAMRIGRYVDRLRKVAIAGHALMQASPHAMFLLGLDGALLAGNDRGQAMLNAQKVLILRGCFLRGRSGDADAVLQRSLNAMSAAAELDGAARRSAFRLPGPEGARPCTLWRLEPEETMRAFGQSTTLLLTVLERELASRADPMLLGAMFDLTPAECRVATALMSGGGLAKIALRMGLSRHTVQSHVKSLFAKTQTHSQSELVARIAVVLA